MCETSFISNSANDTERIAQEISVKLNKGDMITLDGDLGAGKTVFARALIHSLGVDDYVTSPTFTIMNVYDVVTPNKNGIEEIYHFDAYRISSSDEMFEIGYYEYINGDALCIIEWSELIEDILPNNAIRIHILKDENEDNRRLICIKNNA